MLGWNPFNSESFCGAWGRSNIDGVQHGAFTRDSTKDFVLRHKRLLKAIVWKIWLSLPKGKVAVDYSPHASLTFSTWRWHIWSSPICWSCITHRNYVFLAAFTKSRRVNAKTLQPSSAKTLPVEDWCLDLSKQQTTKWQWPANPLNSESFCGAWGRSNIDGVQHGAFTRDSTKGFVLRHRRTLTAIVWKMWLSLPKEKVAVDYSSHASLTFSIWRWHIWSSPICWSCITHRNYVFLAAFTKSSRVNAKTLQPSSAKTSPVEDWCLDLSKQQTTKWQWRWAGILWTQSLFAGLEAEATSMGCSMVHSQEIQPKVLYWDTEELSRLLFGRCGYPCPRKK